MTQKASRILVLGNGPSVNLLDQYQLPSSIITVRLNRYQGPGQTDAVCIGSQAYVDLLPPDILPETVYMARDLKADRPYNRVNCERGTGYDVMCCLLRGWGIQVSAALGFDGINHDIGDQVVQPHNKLTQAAAGHHIRNRWRTQAQAARDRWGVYLIYMHTPAELAQWLKLDR